MKQIIYVFLIVAIVALTYMSVRSILAPIKFEQKRAEREAVVIRKLVDIRKAQVEFKKQNHHYTASFDTLIQFVKEGKMPVVLKEGTLTDEQLESGLTEKEAIKKGLIRRDTSFLNIKTTLFGEKYPVDSICYVPFGNGQKFEMATNVIKSSSGLDVYLFEARTPYEVYLQGLDKQELINIIDTETKLEKYPGLKVGSVVESNNNAGNWE